MSELGELVKHAADFQAIHIQLIALSVDPVAKAAVVRDRFHAPFPILSDAQFKAMNRYGTRSPEYRNRLGISVNTPTLILIDRKGVIRWIHQATDYRVRASVEQDLAEARQLAAAKR